MVFSILLIYCFKVFCYSLVNLKEFSRVWSAIEAIQVVPLIVGVSVTGKQFKVPGTKREKS